MKKIVAVVLALAVGFTLFIPAALADEDGQERVMALQFGAVDKRLERIEALIEGLERRLWMTVYGVVGVILTQAVQSILEFTPKGG